MSPDGSTTHRPSRRARFARRVLRLARLELVGEPPRRGLLIGAPHTSNWDLVITVLVFWAHDTRLRVLVKSEVFWWPLSTLLTAVGAIRTERGGSGGLVARLADAAGEDEQFVLALAPDGTRRAIDHWKSGFYRLAEATGLPVTLAYIDGPNRIVGIGPTLTMTGDVHHDMDRIRAFYADKPGLRPGRGSTVRLRVEGAG